MELIYRIPSKKVPYGYIEIRDPAPINGMPDPTDLAEWYAQFIKEYQAAEVAAFEAAPSKPVKLGPVDDSSVEEATKMLNDGLGGVEEIEENAPVKPWDKTSDETETTAEKPWDLDDSAWDM